MTEQGLHKLKSVFARQIFKQDLLQVYTEQTKQRNTLTQKSRDVLADIIGRTMQKAQFIASPSYDDYVSTDAEARRIATEFLVN